MDLLKELAKDKLVIMVTHNPELAKSYSTRIINVVDGKIVSDTKPFDGKDEETMETPLRYTSLSLLTALKLSKNNLVTKRGRTALIAIAGSIGIIGIAIVLALANGVDRYADSLLTNASTTSSIAIDRAYTDPNATVGLTSTDNRLEHNNALLATDDGMYCDN